jgi:opacity protein-like surface antigen
MSKQRNFRTKFGILTAGVIAMTAAPLASAEQYVAISYGYADLDNSSNSGSFPNGFTTGAGSTIPAGTVLPAGTSVGWNTEFDSGDSFGLAYGFSINNYFRAEIQYARQDNDVDRHTGVVVADSLNIDAEDAGVLITGSGNLGASVAAIVADGRGGIKTDYLMLSAYYDFAGDADFTPFVGLGVGYADADVTFNPSGVGIVDDDDSGFAYQASVGASWAINDSIDLVGELKYRASDDIAVSTTLFPADLEIENKSTNVELGLRYRF